jgi:hypothetical protein
MTALKFLRGDRRTAHVEEPACANLIKFNEPLPRRTAAQARSHHPDDATRQGTRRALRRAVLAAIPSGCAFLADARRPSAYRGWYGATVQQSMDYSPWNSTAPARAQRSSLMARPTASTAA